MKRSIFSVDRGLSKKGRYGNVVDVWAEVINGDGDTLASLLVDRLGSVAVELRALRRAVEALVVMDAGIEALPDETDVER